MSAELQEQAENGRERIEFFIPHRLPGLNEYTLANRQNRYSGARLKHDVQSMILPYLVNVPRMTKYPVRVHFTWQETTKRRDIDNVAFAKKFILDALVVKGILADDNPKHVLAFTDNIQHGKELQEGVAVVVEEI